MQQTQRHSRPYFIAVILVASLWTGVHAQSASPLSPLTNADVVRFVAMGLPEQAVTTLIHEAIDGKSTRFDLSPASVSDLVAHGVSPVVIAAMREPPPVVVPHEATPPAKTVQGPTGLSPAVLAFERAFGERCAAAAARLNKAAVAAYDTPEQTADRRLGLTCWSLLERGADGQLKNTSAERPGGKRKEYGLKVLEILKRQRPHVITYDAYMKLDTNDLSNFYLYDAWETLGALPNEIGRTSIRDDEIVTYQWKNPDGSNVIATFRNEKLVSKAQAGLR